MRWLMWTVPCVLCTQPAARASYMVSALQLEEVSLRHTSSLWHDGGRPDQAKVSSTLMMSPMGFAHTSSRTCILYSTGIAIVGSEHARDWTSLPATPSLPFLHDFLQ